MANQIDYRLTKRRPTNELETENATLPDTKRVLLYGWNADTLSKVRLATDASGNVKLDPTALDTRFLKLDFSNLPTSPVTSGFAANGTTLELWYLGIKVMSWSVVVEPDTLQGPDGETLQGPDGETLQGPF